MINSMKLNSFYRLSIHLFLLVILVSFEATFGFPWLSVFFLQQIIVRSSVVSAWAIIIISSFLLSTAFSNSLLLIFSFLIVLWLYQNIRSFWWWLIYLSIVVATSVTSLTHYSMGIVVQSILSLLFLIFYTKGVIWWPRIWKNNEKIS